MPIEGSSDDEAEEEGNDEYGGETNRPSDDSYPNGSYIYLAKRRQYGLIKSKRSDT